MTTPTPTDRSTNAPSTDAAYVPFVPHADPPLPTPGEPADPATTAEVVAWLYHEAELLDDGWLDRWLELVTDDIRYQVPIRIHKEVTDTSRVTGLSTTGYHLDEDRASLQMRVDRIATGFAWAEEPPSRIRHHVGNVRVRHADRDDEVVVRSNLLVYRGRWDRPEHDLLSAERHDVLRRTADGLRLARRLVVLDSTTLPMLNLTFFF
jgi:ethylbenzene dioxygenase subunit beta